MSQIYQIAIDGPSGAGKSTVAKSLAQALGIDYIDTGAMYRAVAYKLIKEGLDPENKESVKSILDNTYIDFKDGETFLDGENVSNFIRSSQITMVASLVSAMPEVRNKLVSLQQSLAGQKSVVLDGRDIATNVFPKAKYKFFLTASVDERAKRRWEEMKEKGSKIDFGTVREEIVTRDYNDSSRAINPLHKAEDALELDTTGMNVQQVTEFILARLKL